MKPPLDALDAAAIADLRTFAATLPTFLRSRARGLSRAADATLHSTPHSVGYRATRVVIFDENGVYLRRTDGFGGRDGTELLRYEELALPEAEFLAARRAALVADREAREEAERDAERGRQERLKHHHREELRRILAVHPDLREEFARDPDA